MKLQLIHEILPVGMLACNCSIVGDPKAREAIVVDPGDEVEAILEVIAKYDLKVRALVNTHAHIDHVGGLKKLHDATGAPVFMHAEDLELYRNLAEQARWLGVPPPPLTDVDQFLQEGDVVRWGGYEARVLHTPGHTPGSLSLFFEMPVSDPSGADAGPEAPRLLAGDTLFAGSIGRTDLWGGSLPQMLRSLHGKLLLLPDETIVIPGHGPLTTIGDERATNPFLQHGAFGSR